MEPQRGVLLAGVAITYYFAAWFGLLSFDAGVVTTGVFLFGIPAVVLARFSVAPLGVLVNVAVIGFGIALLLEGIAHIYGLWYSIGIDETRLFDLVPLELMIVTTLEVLFLALLYEIFFDDGVYTPHTANTRFGAIGVFVVGLMALLWIYQTFFSGLFFGDSFAWILVVVLACSMAALSVYRVYSAKFLDRLVHFAIIGAVPSLLALVLAVSNTHKIFANPTEYLATFTLYGELIPLEAVLLALAVPFFVATIYELYLDDQS